MVESRQNILNRSQYHLFILHGNTIFLGFGYYTDHPTEKVNGKTIGELESLPEWIKFGNYRLFKKRLYIRKKKKVSEYYESTQKSMEIYHVLLSHKVYHGEAVCIRDDMDDEEKIISSLK